MGKTYKDDPYRNKNAKGRAFTRKVRSSYKNFRPVEQTQTDDNVERDEWN